MHVVVEFEGTLGKLTKSSVNTPRQVLMVVRSEGELVEKEIEKELNSQQKRRKLFMTIEKVSKYVLYCVYSRTSTSVCTVGPLLVCVQWDLY